MFVLLWLFGDSGLHHFQKEKDNNKTKQNQMQVKQVEGPLGPLVKFYSSLSPGQATISSKPQAFPYQCIVRVQPAELQEPRVTTGVTPNSLSPSCCIGCSWTPAGCVVTPSHPGSKAEAPTPHVRGNWVWGATEKRDGAFSPSHNTLPLWSCASSSDIHRCSVLSEL